VIRKSEPIPFSVSKNFEERLASNGSLELGRMKSSFLAETGDESRMPRVSGGSQGLQRKGVGRVSVCHLFAVSLIHKVRNRSPGER